MRALWSKHFVLMLAILAMAGCSSLLGGPSYTGNVKPVSYKYVQPASKVSLKPSLKLAPEKPKNLIAEDSDNFPKLRDVPMRPLNLPNSEEIATLRNTLKQQARTGEWVKSRQAFTIDSHLIVVNSLEQALPAHQRRVSVYQPTTAFKISPTALNAMVSPSTNTVKPLSFFARGNSSAILALSGEIFFQHDSARLNRANHRLLSQIVSSYQKAKNARIHIVGHASQRVAIKDPIKKERVNLDMSWQRTQVVTQALIRKGVKRSRILGLSKGDNEPAQMLFKKTQEQADRRVEIYLEY